MQVFPITNAAGGAPPTLGTAISVGSYLQAIGNDASSTTWVSGSIITDTSAANAVYVINGASNTVTLVAGLSYATNAGRLSGASFHPCVASTA